MLGLVFERFTERARGVVVLAQEEARALKHNYIGTEHILLGLVGEQEGLAGQVLEALNITPASVRELIRREVGSGDEVTLSQIPFTPRAKKVLEMALREALSLGHDYIGTEHLLLGLVRENQGVGIQILLDLGADRDKIRRAIIDGLSAPLGRPGRPASWTPPADHGRWTPPADHGVHSTGLPPALDWRRARLLWRPEGLELRIPLQLNQGALAAFAADAVWGSPPLTGLRREIWDGWVALASPSFLDDTDPVELRQALDGAAQRALDGSGRERGRVEDFLRRLRGAE
jgi:hypothetical protein